jgi:peptide/nickel transport system substrate-binding protein
MKMNPYDRGSTVLPGLATSWEVADDGLQITFHLREGVKFHDGSDLDADDVVASWTRIHAPKGEEISYRKDWFSRIKDVKAVDPLTVEFNYKETSAEMIRFIASDWNSIFPKEVLEANNNDLKTLVDHPAAGPFEFTELKAGELIRYDRFEDYWDEGFPYLDGIEFHMLGKGGFAAFLVGQLDTLQVNNPTDFQLGLDKGISGEKAMVPITHAIYFNVNVKPFDDLRVRQAMDLVIDRTDWGIVTQDITSPAVGRWAPPGNAFALPDAEFQALPIMSLSKEERLAKAKALMAEAGYSDGFATKLTSGSPQHVVVHAEFSAAVWKETLNIDLEVEVLDWSVWIARARKQQFDITSGAQFTTLQDPSDFMNTFWRSGGAQNWTGWSNPKFDALMDKVDTELDPAKRIEHVHAAFEVLEADVPQVNGGWEVDGHMWWPYVRGFPSRGPEMGRYVFFDRQTLWLDK